MAAPPKYCAESISEYDIPGAHLRVLLVEDNPNHGDLILRELARDGFIVQWEVVQDRAAFLHSLQRQTPDVILADFNLPQWHGMEALEVLREQDLDIPLILVSGALGDVTAVECIKKGATDYVLKDSLARLPSSVRRALRERQLRVQRERAEEELARKAEELARSNAELEQFAYAASHDLQEPLRMVASYTQLLAEQYSAKLDDKAQKYIRYAVVGSLRMQGLIRDLLEFSRVGHHAPKLQPVDCGKAFKAAIYNLEAAISDSHAEICCGELPTVMADRTRLVQLFQNLLGNAIKFRGSERPRIEVAAHATTARDSLTALPREEHVISVRDNGIGITEDNLAGIFEVFKRLHTHEEYPGNGIGLSLCKKIVEQLGGRIWVESSLGKGSTFCVALPATSEISEAQLLAAEAMA